MKILYLSHRIPYPPNKGDKIRSCNEVKHLAKRHELDLICLADEPEDMKYQADLEKICRRVAVFSLNKALAKLRGLTSLAFGKSISVGYFHQRDMQECFDSWVEQNVYDAIVCFSSTMAEYVFQARVFDRLEKRPVLIMDFCDVDSDKWLQYAADARFPMGRVYRLENRRLADYERKVYRTFDHSILISEAEAALFRQICPESRTSVIPNGVDFNYFAPEEKKSGGKPTGCHLAFTGAMDYHANVDGVCWFCSEIHPLLKRDFPELTFSIVGSNPTAAVKELGNLDGVTVTGFVDDVRPYYQEADVCVIPLRLARGVQNKVLESMAMGKAVVTTSKANAGIQAVDNQHLLIADSVEGFAGAVANLLKDSQQRIDFGKKAREFVVAGYDWATNMAKLEDLLC